MQIRRSDGGLPSQTLPHHFDPMRVLVLLAFLGLTSFMGSVAMEGTCGSMGTGCELISPLSDQTGMVQMRWQLNGSPEGNTCAAPPCPVDCLFTWSEWTACSQTCGTGIESRSHTVTREPAHFGSACPQDDVDVHTGKSLFHRPCHMGHCPQIALGQWVVQDSPMDHPGRYWDCEGDWGAWTTCSKTCGEGRWRSTYWVTHGSHDDQCTGLPYIREGGSPGDTKEGICNSHSCPVHCEGSWNSWTSCSKTCGGGTRSRLYVVQQDSAGGGSPCPRSPETRTCNSQACPVNCEGSWNSWTTCSKSCGGGTKSRSYTVQQNATDGGSSCISGTTNWGTGIPAWNQKLEYLRCNSYACPIDCAGSWSSWSTCTKTCNGGREVRSYIVGQRPAYGGTACPLNQKQSCNSHACITGHCAAESWSRWTHCSQHCAGGIRVRRYIVGGRGGKFCPRKQTQSCNSHACPGGVRAVLAANSSHASPMRADHLAAIGAIAQE